MVPSSFLAGAAIVIIVAMLFAWRVIEEKEATLWRRAFRALAWVAVILFLSAIFLTAVVSFLFRDRWPFGH